MRWISVKYLNEQFRAKTIKKYLSACIIYCLYSCPFFVAFQFEKLFNPGANSNLQENGVRSCIAWIQSQHKLHIIWIHELWITAVAGIWKDAYSGPMKHSGTEGKLSSPPRVSQNSPLAQCCEAISLGNARLVIWHKQNSQFLMNLWDKL